MKRRTKARIARGIAATALLAAAAIAGYLLYCRIAAHTEPSPDEGTLIRAIVGDAAAEEDDGDGFPDVDWDYWQSVNPDVIGWITIPGTDVNAPIVQAHASDPDYYLTHDVYGNYNRHGAIYLDAECEEHGLASRNAVILGHHYGYEVAPAPFGVLADYKDEEFAAEHATVLIQTPDSKAAYEVRFAELVDGNALTKRTSFESEEDYLEWYASEMSEAIMVLDGEAEPEQVVSLVTCSYNYLKSNERTVVFASLESVEDGELELEPLPEEEPDAEAEPTDEEASADGEGSGEGEASADTN